VYSRCLKNANPTRRQWRRVVLHLASIKNQCLPISRERPKHGPACKAVTSRLRYRVKIREIPHKIEWAQKLLSRLVPSTPKPAVKTCQVHDNRKISRIITFRFEPSNSRKECEGLNAGKPILTYCSSLSMSEIMTILVENTSLHRWVIRSKLTSRLVWRMLNLVTR